MIAIPEEQILMEQAWNDIKHTHTHDDCSAEFVEVYYNTN